MNRLVLASTSTFKASLLARLRLPFETSDPGVDEVHIEGESASVRAERLALEKARACARDDAFCIGADQVIALGETMFDKPETIDRAVEQLMALAGRTHELLCCCATVSPSGEEQVTTVRFQMTMRAFDEARARDYVVRDQTTQCAGSYKIESEGIALFESMRGDDFTAIIGLPLTVVQTQLEALRFFDE